MDTMGPLGQARSTMDIGHFMAPLRQARPTGHYNGHFGFIATMDIGHLHFMVPLGQARPIMDTLGSLRQAMPTMMMIYCHQNV